MWGLGILYIISTSSFITYPSIFSRPEIFSLLHKEKNNTRSSTEEIKEGKTLSKKNYVLSQEQKESLIGILLADGILVKAKPEHNTRLRIDHTYPSQEAYVISIYTLFKSMVNMEPTILERKADIRTEKLYKSALRFFFSSQRKKNCMGPPITLWKAGPRADRRDPPYEVWGRAPQSIYFWTLSFACFNPYFHFFYNGKTKIVPINIEELLTARGLAHWIMGDGFYMTSRGVIVLCTESFTKEETNLLIAALKNKFDIKATFNKRVLSTGLDGWRIRISKKSMKKVTTIVDPYIIPEFRYKLGENNINNL